MGRDRAVFEDPQISGNGVYDIKDLAIRPLRPEPVNLRCSGRNPTVTAPGAPSNGNTTDPTHITPSLTSPLIKLIGGDPMKPAMNRLCGLQ